MRKQDHPSLDTKYSMGKQGCNSQHPSACFLMRLHKNTPWFVLLVIEPCLRTVKTDLCVAKLNTLKIFLINFPPSPKRLIFLHLLNEENKRIGFLAPGSFSYLPEDKKLRCHFTVQYWLWGKCWEGELIECGLQMSWITSHTDMYCSLDFLMQRWFLQ